LAESFFVELLRELANALSMAHRWRHVRIQGSAELDRAGCLRRKTGEGTVTRQKHRRAKDDDVHV